jgi:hypothetical protein
MDVFVNGVHEQRLLLNWQLLFMNQFISVGRRSLGVRS